MDEDGRKEVDDEEGGGGGGEGEKHDDEREQTGENVKEDGKRTKGLGGTGTRMGGGRSTTRKEKEEEVKERNMTMSENRHRCADEEVKERKTTMSANRHRRLATKSPHFRHQAQRVILVTKSPALRPLRVTAVTLMLWAGKPGDLRLGRTNEGA